MTILQNFKNNSVLIFKDKIFRVLISFILFFTIINKVLPIFGYYLVYSLSGSDQNGIYFITPIEDKTVNNNDYVSFCLNDKAALHMASLYGLPTKKGVCKNGSYPLIKHVCGLPNQTIKYQDGKFYVNDQFINSRYITSKNTINEINWNINNTYKLDSDKYFMCGKNKLSFDSRYYGAIPKNDFIGKGYLLIPLPTMSNQ